MSLCCLLGADIAFDPDSPVPNPNNIPFAVQGSGTYKIDDGETFIAIIFEAKNTKTGDKTINIADIKENKWTKMIMVAPGNYDCRGLLFHIPKGDKTPTFVGTQIRNVKVK